MQRINMARICELDADCGRTVREDICTNLSLATIQHDDHQRWLVVIAGALGIVPEEFVTFVWLQVYCLARSQTCADTPDLKVAAEHVGITQQELEDYLEARCEQQSSEVDVWDDDVPIVEDVS